MICDAQWAEQEAPQPNVKPQTHFVRAKINPEYHVTSGNYIINTTSNAILYLQDLTKDKLLKDPASLNLVADMLQCNNSKISSIGQIRINVATQDSLYYLSLQGELKIPADSEFEAHFYNFGDTSYCGVFLGEPFNFAKYHAGATSSSIKLSL